MPVLLLVDIQYIVNDQIQKFIVTAQILFNTIVLGSLQAPLFPTSANKCSIVGKAVQSRVPSIFPKPAAKQEIEAAAKLLFTSHIFNICVFNSAIKSLLPIGVNKRPLHFPVKV